jgi:hypothetical protein
MKRRPRTRQDRQRGIALIVVTTALAIAALLFNEFKTNTVYDKYAADNSLDQMRGELLARSSMNLSELILRLQQVLDSDDVKQQIGEVQLTDYADMFMMAFGGTSEEVFGATGLKGDDAKGFGAEIGSFGVSITTEDGKINVNCANGKPESAQLTYTLIDALYYFPAFDPIFEEPSADGWTRDRRLQTEAIMDFIDADRDKVPPPGEARSGGGEDYGYENLSDKYQPKNDYLDSIDEMKLIRGVDERFWTLFGPSFTVYGGCKLNVNALEDPRIIAAVLYLTAKNREDPVIRDGALLWYHALAVSFARQNGFPFATTAEFTEFVKDPEAQLGMGLADPTGEGTGAGTGAAAPPIPIQIPGVPTGTDLALELDQALVDKVLRSGPRRTYRVEAWGQVTRNAIMNPILRKLTAVWDMGNVNVNQRSTDTKARNGAWIYVHVQ